MSETITEYADDNFDASVSRPLNQSYHVLGKLYAGEYPGDRDKDTAETKLKRMHHFGVRHFIDLTEEGELRQYSNLLPKDTTYMRFPIKDLNAPESIEAVHNLIDRIEYLTRMNGYTYLHCWGGVGRTGTITACYFARTINEPTQETVLNRLRAAFKEMPKSAHRVTPETKEQLNFIERFIKSCRQRKEMVMNRIHDRIRGCLTAGAAGDALGYPVEFMSRKEILAHYGARGITHFELNREKKALISDDTQMTLFTANGMLMGITRGCMRGIGGRPEDYVDGAYIDWYYTQTGRKRLQTHGDFHYTWLRDIPELAHRRAPGMTCLNACKAILNHQTVTNNSKGCGGIMRVAPMALLMAAHPYYSINEMDEAGAKIAAATHLHPLGFLPAAMLTHLLYRLICTNTDEIQYHIGDIALESINCLDNIYAGEYIDEKRDLADLTRKAVELARNDKPDADNIALLGEGWTAEETWAIALYCAVRHIGSVADAIIAAVNHDGDSDSTGSVCGNIMGVIYGYEVIKHQRLFCPHETELEQTLELSDIILAIADDLYTGCIINEFAPIDTPEKQQWYERYCEMIPSGLQK